MRLFITLVAVVLASCSGTAPVDNGAATSCAAGTPENEASSGCKDVELKNGATVAVPPLEGAEDEIPEEMLSSNAN